MKKLTLKEKTTRANAKQEKIAIECYEVWKIAKAKNPDRYTTCMIAVRYQISELFLKLSDLTITRRTRRCPLRFAMQLVWNWHRDTKWRYNSLRTFKLIVFPSQLKKRSNLTFKYPHQFSLMSQFLMTTPQDWWIYSVQLLKLLCRKCAKFGRLSQ